MIEQWSMLVADFASEYRIDLEHVIGRRTWRWFEQRVQGLLTADTRLARHFLDLNGGES